MMTKIATAIRLILTTALLAVVWFNVHWSVALCLTLLAMANELQELYAARDE